MDNNNHNRINQEDSSEGEQVPLEQEDLVDLEHLEVGLTLLQIKDQLHSALLDKQPFNRLRVSRINSEKSEEGKLVSVEAL